MTSFSNNIMLSGSVVFLLLLVCVSTGSALSLIGRTRRRLRKTHLPQEQHILDEDDYDYGHEEQVSADEVGAGTAEIGGHSWVQGKGSGEDADFPFVYVIFGHGGQPLARAIVQDTAECPAIQLEGVETQPEVTVRGTGTAGGIYDFPVRVCEARLPKTLSGGKFGGRKLPALTTSPKNYVLLGDTGLRVKPTNLGTCKTKKPKGPKVYGVHQCEEGNSVPFDPKLVSGSYQDLGNWPLDPLMEEAAKAKPDVVVHVGDFLYRQGPCAESLGCKGINKEKAYGDNWRGWREDFFIPARPLLEAAPFIVIRGNHENCGRGGHGWFLFLDPQPLPAEPSPEDIPGLYCRPYTDVYAIPFEHEQFIVMDDSAISPMNGGIDHMDFNHKCPGGKVLTAEETDRHHDAKQKTADIEKQLEIFTGYFERVRKLAEGQKTNVYASHRPLYAVACNGTSYVTLDWTMQQASRRAGGSLDRVTLSVNGHMHWFEGLDFKDRGHPAQLVVGNGGTKLIPNKVAQVELSSNELEILGHTVSKGVTHSAFGFTTMTSGDPAKSFEVTSFELDSGASPPKKPFWEHSVARGPRVGPGSKSGTIASYGWAGGAAWSVSVSVLLVFLSSIF